MRTSRLMLSKRFSPLFWTLFFGALNDNFLKNALVILITYKSLNIWGLPPAQMVALSGGIFILPFFLFSTLAGQLSDKYEKSAIVRYTKVAEVLLMAIAAYGFLEENYNLLIWVLFLTGVQSAFFGPVKYSILPQHLKEEELVGGNALVELGTFVAILIGTIVGGVLIGMQPAGAIYVSIGLMLTSAGGWVASTFVPRAESFDKNLKINLNPITQFFEMYKITVRTRSVFLSVIGISWFWLFGGAILSVLPTYVKDTLSGDESIVTLFLTVFTIGIAAGSMLCEKLSFHRLELGLVPLGAIGVTIFTLDLFFVGTPYTSTELLGIREFLARPGGVRISFDLFMLSLFSGFMIVPLYTLIQQRSDPQYRSRIVAANNILNSLFMVVSAIGLTVLLGFNYSIPEIFLILGILNAVVSIYIYSVIPEFFLRFLTWVLVRIFYRLKIKGLEHIPKEGPALLICNHVSFVDWLVISGAVPRPVRFVMDHSYANFPLLRHLLRQAKVIPIATGKENPKILESAFETVYRELKNGEIVCIFPEGKITRDGNLNTFRPGVEKIVTNTPVPVIPMALKGLWGSFFSYKDKIFYSKKPKPFFYRVELEILPPVPAHVVKASDLQLKVASML